MVCHVYISYGVVMLLRSPKGFGGSLDRSADAQWFIALTHLVHVVSNSIGEDIN